MNPMLAHGVLLLGHIYGKAHKGAHKDCRGPYFGTSPGDAKPLAKSAAPYHILAYHLS